MKVYWIGSPKFNSGRPAPVVALVHHRMVGSLRSCDATFTTGTRQASTNFGVGYACGRSGHPVSDAHVHQYVNIDDSAWGNGNWDASGSWNDRYPTTYVNARTISIEHHDNGGAALGKGRGIVPEKVIVASIQLDLLLKSGDVEAWRDAGIRWRSGAAAAKVAKEVKAIVPGPHTIIDHHYIAGRLKPYCWRPWSDDTVGFPQERYIAALGGPPDTATEEPMSVLTITKLPFGGSFTIPAGASPDGIKLDAAGKIVARLDWTAKDAPSSAPFDAYVDLSGLGIRGNPFLRCTDGFFEGYYISSAGLTVEEFEPPAPPPDTTPISQAQLDAAVAAAREEGVVSGTKVGWNAALATADRALGAIPRK